MPLEIKQTAAIFYLVQGRNLNPIINVSNLVITHLLIEVVIGRIMQIEKVLSDEAKGQGRYHCLRSAYILLGIT